jgi:ABC-2 type transport system permease protein
LPAVWVLLGYGILVGFFAPILDISETAVSVSPFEHVGEYPLENIAVGAVLALIAVAGVVLAAALGTFRRRDLTTT